MKQNRFWWLLASCLVSGPGMTMPGSVQVNGSADIGFFAGGKTYPTAAGGTTQPSFDIADARFFITADFASSDYYDAAGFNLEWNFIRTRETYNFVGEAYVDLQGLFGSSWLNVQVGRFQIPLTENYLRFSGGKASNPFVSQTAGGLWYWDEGLRFYGATAERGFGYVFSISDGEANMGQNPLSDFSTESDTDFNSGKQTTLRLFSQMTPEWYLSGSLFATGEVGMSALWFGESSVKPVGMGVAVDQYIDGATVPDGGGNENVTGAGFDVVYDNDYVRFWFDYAQVHIDNLDDRYDRDLEIMSLEGVFQGTLVSRELVNSYFGIRYSEIGTGDADRGYLLDRRYMQTVGWNMQSYEALSFVVGQRLSSNLTLKFEYTLLDIELVNGASSQASISEAVADNDYGAIVLTASF